MNELNLLIDASVNPKTKVGYGAYLFVSDIQDSPGQLRDQVQVKRFENTSSTKLELQTLLWAFENIPKTASKILIYTDSQNIKGLLGRRQRLKKNNYRSKKDRAFNNAELYQQFYRRADQIDCEIIKIKGHKKSVQKNNIDRLFTWVDRTARSALRNSVSTG